MVKNILYAALLLFLLVDAGYSFLQHYHQPFDGDMPTCILPGEDTRPVLDSPLGLRAIVEGDRYANPNRFFSHWAMYRYFNTVPFWWHSRLSPLDSAYLASALFKTLIQLAILLLLSMAVTGSTRPWQFRPVLAAAILTPLFQTNGYFDYMGIIDRSTTYTFFYAFPLALLLLYFLPLFLRIYHRQPVQKFRPVKLLWIPLALVCCLSGPTNPGIALVISLLVYGQQLAAHLRTNGSLTSLKQFVRDIPQDFHFFLLPLVLFSLYSLYLGTYNSANLEHAVSLAERYARLPLGLYYQFTQKLGWPVLFLLLLINTLLIRFRYRQETEGEKILATFQWIGLFALIYILLLPLGGYRPYRPYILRYDTIMPITLGLFFVYGQSTLFLLRHLTREHRRWYLPLLVLVLFVFANADEPGFSNNDCEKAAIEQFANGEEVVLGSDQCTVLSWMVARDPAQSQLVMQLLQRWGVVRFGKS